jgi:hypothetical protein
MQEMAILLASKGADLNACGDVKHNNIRTFGRALMISLFCRPRAVPLIGPPCMDKNLPII